MNTELELAQHFVELHPEEAASALEKLNVDRATALLSELEIEPVARLLTHLHPHAGAECLRRLPAELGAELLKVMPRDRSALLLRRMQKEVRELLLNATSPEVASGLGLLLRFPENTAGALMDPDVLSLPSDLRAGDALEHVRRSGVRITYYVYVTDRQSRLVGVVNLRELIGASEDQSLQDILNAHVERVSVHADPVSIAAQPGWTEYYALPVVDDHGVLVGILRYKTLRAVAEAAGRSQDLNPFDVSLALGELYWSTLGQLVRMLWTTEPREQTQTGESS